MNCRAVRHPIAALALIALAAGPAAAQSLSLTLRDGRVTLVADNVPVRQILAEWARIGQTRIVNGDQVMGSPVTLQLDGVSEKEALDILLRSAAGYVAAPRQTAAAGLSVFDRILIMPTSRPPANTMGVPPPFQPQPVQQRGVPQPFPMPTPPDDDNQGDPLLQPQPGLVQPGVMPPGLAGQPGLVPNPGGTYLQPQGTQQPVTLPRPGMLPQPQQPPVNPYIPGRGGVPPVRPGGGGRGGEGGPGGEGR
jgi:hypothetical protein